MTDTLFYQALGEKLKRESWEALTTPSLLSMLEDHGLDPSWFHQSKYESGRVFFAKKDLFLPVWREAEGALRGFQKSLRDKQYPVKEVLCEGVMVVLEALLPYRSFLEAVDKDKLLLLNKENLSSLAEILLSLGGVSTSGVKGFARIQGMLLVLLATFSVWLSDTSPDQAATLSMLDQKLVLAEQVMGFLGL